jgi:hypothetical protein
MPSPYVSGFSTLSDDVAPMAPYALRMLTARAVASAGADQPRLLWLATLLADTASDFTADGMSSRGVDTHRLAQLLQRQADLGAPTRETPTSGAPR